MFNQTKPYIMDFMLFFIIVVCALLSALFIVCVFTAGTLLPLVFAALTIYMCRWACRELRSR